MTELFRIRKCPKCGFVHSPERVTHDQREVKAATRRGFLIGVLVVGFSAIIAWRKK